MGNEIWEKIKNSWNWIWHSDSIWSWFVAVIVIFIAVKFIFFPVLSLIMGTSIPLAGVDSSSMDHQIVKNSGGTLSLCDKTYPDDYKERLDYEGYWDVCGDWYGERGITKRYFSEFPLSGGFSKGDIIIVWGRFTPKVGDVIIFKPNQGSIAPRPIIHRIISIGEGVIQTKGDHNDKQLTGNNNFFKTDETNITEDKVIGKAIIKIPYLGWLKIWVVELINKLFG